MESQTSSNSSEIIDVDALRSTSASDVFIVPETDSDSDGDIVMGTPQPKSPTLSWLMTPTTTTLRRDAPRDLGLESQPLFTPSPEMQQTPAQEATEGVSLVTLATQAGLAWSPPPAASQAADLLQNEEAMEVADISLPYTGQPSEYELATAVPGHVTVSASSARFIVESVLAARAAAYKLWRAAVDNRWPAEINETTKELFESTKTTDGIVKGILPP